MEIFMVNSTIVNFSNSGDKEIQLATPHHPLTHSTYQLFSLEFYSEDWRSSCKLTIHQKMGGTPLSSTIFWAGALADAWRMWHGHWSLCGKTNEIKQPTLRVQIKHPNVQKKRSFKFSTVVEVCNLSSPFLLRSVIQRVDWTAPRIRAPCASLGEVQLAICQDSVGMLPCWGLCGDQLAMSLQEANNEHLMTNGQVALASWLAELVKSCESHQVLVTRLRPPMAWSGGRPVAR